MIHCDLKGANILVDSNGKIKLSDFGCSKTFENTISNIKDQMKGSMCWLAPEVILNTGMGRKSDIWSLGIVLIEMAVAGNPWGDNFFSSHFEACLKIANTDALPEIPSHLS